MTGVIDERNGATTERLRVLADRDSDDDLARAIDPPWTVSALFAHIAFWDRFVHGRWGRAAYEGVRTPVPVDDLPQDLINEASLPSWLAVPARIAVDGCLAAASDVDDLRRGRPARRLGRGRRRGARRDGSSAPGGSLDPSERSPTDA
jgi:hypothetical protein